MSGDQGAAWWTALEPGGDDDLDRRVARWRSRLALFGDGGEQPSLGRYTIEGRIGEGATGVVYLGRDAALDRAVALKVLAVAGDAEVGKARLLREARALAKLSHPNVVTVFEVGEDAGTAFIAMERVEGETLGAWVARRKPPWHETVRLLVDAGRGLAAAHAASIVHRDFKPDNVVVGIGDRPKVVDFGLAHPDALAAAEPGSSSGVHLTRTGAIVGTPAFAAPEQLGGTPADARSDQFGFCATLHHALFGAAPFGGGSIDDIAQAIARGLELPRGTDVPQRVLRAIRRGLHLEPAQRFSSMEELLVELEAALGSRGSRRWWIAGAGIAAAGALVASAIAMERPVPTGATTPVAPALEPRAELGCPILEASGVTAPEAWLGAAAANLACRSAGWLLGGREDRVLVPAELVGLAGVPIQDLPADPWADAGARARSLEAARSGARVVLDGSVRATADGFDVSLRVERGGAPVARSAAVRAPLLVDAVRGALDDLVAQGALVEAPRLDSELGEWLLVRTPRAGAWLAETRVALETDVHAKRCDDLERWTPDLGLAAIEARRMCDEARGRPSSPAELDRSSPVAVAITAPHALERKSTDAVGVATELRALRLGASNGVYRTTLAIAEARLLALAGDHAAAYPLMFDVVRETPGRWGLYWEVQGAASSGEAGRAVTRAWTAWLPEDPDGWRNASTFAACPGGAPDVCAPARVALQRRASGVAPGCPQQAALLGLRLLEAGRTEEAREIGAAIDSRAAGHGLAAAYVLGLVDAKEAKLGRGLDRMMRAIRSIDAPMRRQDASVSLLNQVTRLAAVVGRQQELGELIATHIVLGERSFVPLRYRGADPPIALACMHAPRTIAERCLSRLRELATIDGARVQGDENRDAFLAGAEKFARGDLAGAAARWRPLIGVGGNILVPAEVFDALGEPDVASRIDASHLSSPGQYAGANPAQAREARRAEARGETGRARELAQQVVDAWIGADVPVPELAEMRRLLARLGPPP